MLIQSLIERAKGTKVTIGGVNYHFKPQPPHITAHVADVTHKAHISRLLSIPEGFAVFDEVETDAVPSIAPLPVDAQRIERSQPAGLADDFSAHLADPQGADTPASQQADELDDEDADIEEDAQTQAPGAIPGEGAILSAELIDQMDEDALRHHYGVLNGRAAPGNILPDTLRTKLKELVEAQ